MAKHKSWLLLGTVTLFPYSSCTRRKMRMVFTRSVHGAGGTPRRTRKAGQMRSRTRAALLLRSAAQKQMPLPTAHNVPNYSPLTSAQAARGAGSVPGCELSPAGKAPTWGAAPLPMDAGGNTAAVAAGHAGLGWLLLCSLKGCKSLAQRCRTISPRRLEQPTAGRQNGAEPKQS